jgi:hypothetical protein
MKLLVIYQLIPAVLNKLALGLTIVLFWATNVHASLISYDLSGVIRDYDFASSNLIEVGFIGNATLDTDTHTADNYGGWGAEPDYFTHNYELSYTITALDSSFSYSGVGSLNLAGLHDIHLSLDGFDHFYGADPNNAVFDPPLGPDFWHDVFDFDVASLETLNLGNYDSGTHGKAGPAWLTTSSVPDFITMSRSDVDAPEASTFLLFVSGLLGMSFVRRIRQ